MRIVELDDPLRRRASRVRTALAYLPFLVGGGALPYPARAVDCATGSSGSAEQHDAVPGQDRGGRGWRPAGVGGRRRRGPRTSPWPAWSPPSKSAPNRAGPRRRAIAAAGDRGRRRREPSSKTSPSEGLADLRDERPTAIAKRPSRRDAMAGSGDRGPRPGSGGAGVTRSAVGGRRVAQGPASSGRASPASPRAPCPGRDRGGRTRLRRRVRRTSPSGRVVAGVALEIGRDRGGDRAGWRGAVDLTIVAAVGARGPGRPGAGGAAALAARSGGPPSWSVMSSSAPAKLGRCRATNVLPMRSNSRASASNVEIGGFCDNYPRSRW